jgi:hypothetical protein
MTYNSKDKLDEVLREIGYRQYVYPRQIAAGKMNQHTADRRIAVMRAIADDYERELEKERLL